ncbi:N-acetylglucosamine-6-phosphate deacetylase [Stappia sp. ES.058]|uniref:N-acetylglucosamine-6-phosphate deacetylase n=1 Tax=Stappia sp. ES.058 TaxID=1881061 RepID=UPI0008796AC7|nr:N-acetylglucosamine-6-phosphate deacetylase [Stappia sp. ES.058]SDU45808.1 N-acetylglucosamine 6-phosphate deacetylase [Stappia sp. ES.058]
MSGGTALIATTIFDGDRMHPDSALLIEDGRVRALVPVSEIPRDAERIDTEASLLCPGFVDWQVNGGGGVLFNETPTADGARAIAAAHARFGTTTLLPTVITDTPDVTAAAASAIAQVIADGNTAIAGVHFEGPHISVEKCGVHDPSFIRPMERSDRDRLTRDDLGAVVSTVAPENASLDDIRSLSRAGVHVSLGHSNAGFVAASAALKAGARSVTHLFNAMSGLHHRDPGLAGAALANAQVYCGLIPDGHHVHPAMLDLALRAAGHRRITLVTDAMSSVGHADDRFELNGRTVMRENGRLTIADGTLAGSDLDMISGVRIMADACGAPFQDVLRMASRCPAQMLGLHDRGHLRPGARADILGLDADRALVSVWIAGTRQEH